MLILQISGPEENVQTSSNRKKKKYMYRFVWTETYSHRLSLEEASQKYLSPLFFDYKCLLHLLLSIIFFFFSKLLTKKLNV